MRNIEIDFDVHKIIEGNRTGFHETANDVLRRILGLGEATPADDTGTPQDGRSWSSKGVTLPHGTLLKMQYNGQAIEGRVDDGAWLVDGQTFKSPSGAAKGTAKTKNGTRPSLDGWAYWSVLLPDTSDWKTISSILHGK